MPGIGELALGPFLFGASSALLNADHYDVYFKGMPRWNGMVLNFSDMPSYLRYVSSTFNVTTYVIPLTGVKKTWRCV